MGIEPLVLMFSAFLIGVIANILSYPIDSLNLKLTSSTDMQPTMRYVDP